MKNFALFLIAACAVMFAVSMCDHCTKSADTDYQPYTRQSILENIK